MTPVLVIAGVVAPLLPLVLFPTRFFGRGLGMTLLGAVLLVGALMLVWWSLNGLGGDSTSPDTAALAGLSSDDLSTLEKLF